MNKAELHEFLELKFTKYNAPVFIETDPIQIPHQFQRMEDIEISGFLTATIAWGQRVSIIKNASRLMMLMDQAPYEFIHDHQPNDLNKLKGFVHRTFNFEDLSFFLRAMQNIYREHGSMESLFIPPESVVNLKESIIRFRSEFFRTDHQLRSRKHVSDPATNSACKRINMFLRWMVRQDNAGVDFGIWRKISPSLLSCPLDVHSGRVARKLGLLNRKQNDWKAVEELDNSLRRFDPKDPVKYDFTLFGLGIFEKF